MTFTSALFCLCLAGFCLEEIHAMTSPESSNKRRAETTSPGRSEDDVIDGPLRKVTRTLFDDPVGSADLNACNPDSSLEDENADASIHLEGFTAENFALGYQSSIESCASNSPQADDVNTSVICDEPLNKKVENLLKDDHLSCDSDIENSSQLHNVNDSVEIVENLSVGHYEPLNNSEIETGSELSNACDEHFKSVDALLLGNQYVDHDHHENMSCRNISEMDRTFQFDHQVMSKYEELRKDAENELLSQETPEKVSPNSSLHSDFHDVKLDSVDISGEMDLHKVELLDLLWSRDTINPACSTPVKGSDLVTTCRVEDFPLVDGMDWGSSESSDEASVGSESEEPEEDAEDHEQDVEGSESSVCDQAFDTVDESEATASYTKACLLNSVKVHSYSNLSVNEGVLKIMDLHVKNKQSKAGLGRAIETVCSLLPEGHNLPTSSHDILQYVESLAPPIPATSHFYCQSCLFYHGTSIVGLCEICKVATDFGRFFCFDVAALIKFFFEHRNLAAIIDTEAAKTSDTPGLKTLRDGSVYQDINRNKSKYDVNIILYSDGVRIRKGGKELWLAMFTISEVPTHLQKSFLTVLGVWYDEKKPNMITFLTPFAETMVKLDQGNLSGVEWTHPTTKASYKSCVRLPVTVLDAPARAIIQNAMYFNSMYGCNLCEVKAELTAPVPGKKRVRRFFYVNNIKLRTKARMLKQAQEVGDKQHVKGVKGPSVLSIIPSVDISKCIVPEYLHCCLLGVCKQLLTIWTAKVGLWSLKDRISEIDSFLKTFKHPSFVHRRLRQLQSLQYWKASDFYYFMFFEAVFALQGHLPQVYLQHFYLFVMSIFKLIKTVVTEADLHEADIMLKLFVMDFAVLYSDRELVSNVHQLLHLPLCVRRYGPLHCFSAFISEDLNGLIAKATHGTRFVDVEIVRNIKICQGLHMLRNIVSGHTIVNNSEDLYSQCELLGKEANISLSPEEMNFFREEKPKIYFRAKLGFDEYSSEMYKPLQSENFYIMWTEDGCEKYGSIRFFAETSFDKFVVFRLFKVDHTKVFYHTSTRKCIEHLVPVLSSDNFICVRVSDIVQSIVKVGKKGTYIYKRPNLYRYVM